MEKGINTSKIIRSMITNKREEIRNSPSMPGCQSAIEDARLFLLVVSCIASSPRLWMKVVMKSFSCARRWRDEEIERCVSLVPSFGVAQSLHRACLLAHDRIASRLCDRESFFLSISWPLCCSQLVLVVSPSALFFGLFK